MDNDDLAWVAGLLEGDGFFWKQTSRRGYVRVGVGVKSTDEDVLRYLERLIPESRIRGPFEPRSLGKKPYWHWELGLRLVVIDLLKQIRPWMGKRRTEQIDAVLAHHASRPAVRNAITGHPAEHGTVTRWGQGCRCDRCRAADNAYQREGRCRRAKMAESAGINDGRILRYLIGNPGSTVYQMAEMMQLDEHGIRADLKRLRSVGRVRRHRAIPTDAWSWDVVTVDG